MKIDLIGELTVRDSVDQHSLICVQSDGLGDRRALDSRGEAEDDGGW